ncbi:MAG TPA: AraC family transcriptional regulator [Candidatus Rubrimentiphilum sp.]|nr:AraC family transcriptional regulator [Candidatus Rubrimentiphilum sp.]
MSLQGRLVSERRCGDVVVCDRSYDDRTVLHEHRHSHAYVSVLVEGAYTELRDGLPRSCRPGTAIYHPPGEAHADAFAGEGRCINFELAEAAHDSAGARRKILAAAEKTHPEHARTVARALEAFAYAERLAAAPEWLARVCREFPWIEPVPLEEAARLAGVHRTRFIRSFSEHAGVTPVRYRRRERVRAASSLLLESLGSLSYIAHECGFSDQSHLTNVFREETGMSPARYRRAFAR